MERTLTIHHTRDEVVELLYRLQSSQIVGTESKRTLIEVLECIRDDKLDRLIATVKDSVND